MAVIEVRDLVKRYNRAKEASVKGISFAVEEGEFFAFLGPNGAGKTTSISILTTTLAKTSGEVRIAGFDVEREDKQVREQIGIIFQKPSLDKQLTAEQNIRFHACLYGMYAYRPTFSLMPASYKKRVTELAEIVGIEDALGTPIKKLSGGMQRKLEIIRSLIHTPKILFLDEPTQGLDAVSRRGLWDYINEVRQRYGTTVFLTTHYIDEAENVDKVCIINHGQIVISGSPEEMRRSLLRQELLLDAEPEERGSLLAELEGMGLKPVVDPQGQHLVVPYGGGAGAGGASAAGAGVGAGVGASGGASVDADSKTNAPVLVAGSTEARASAGANASSSDGRTPQDIIAGLSTRLTLLKVQEPTLEDAYIEYLAKTAVPADAAKTAMPEGVAPVVSAKTGKEAA